MKRKKPKRGSADDLDLTGLDLSEETDDEAIRRAVNADPEAVRKREEAVKRQRASKRQTGA